MTSAAESDASHSDSDASTEVDENEAWTIIEFMEENLCEEIRNDLIDGADKVGTLSGRLNEICLQRDKLLVKSVPLSTLAIPSKTSNNPANKSKRRSYGEEMYANEEFTMHPEVMSETDTWKSTPDSTSRTIESAISPAKEISPEDVKKKYRKDIKALNKKYSEQILQATHPLENRELKELLKKHREEQEELKRNMQAAKDKFSAMLAAKLGRLSNDKSAAMGESHTQNLDSCLLKVASPARGRPKDSGSKPDGGAGVGAQRESAYLPDDNYASDDDKYLTAYHDVMTNDGSEESNSESDCSSDENSSSEESSDCERLRGTLTEEIHEHWADIGVEEFHFMMDAFRERRDNKEDVSRSEMEGSKEDASGSLAKKDHVSSAVQRRSLWARASQKKLQRSQTHKDGGATGEDTLRSVGSVQFENQSIGGTQSNKAVPGVDATTSTEYGVKKNSGTGTTDDRVSSSSRHTNTDATSHPVTSDAETTLSSSFDMKKAARELDGMADDMAEALKTAKDEQKVKDLLREHMTNVENYRRQKEQQLSIHNAKLQEKLVEAGLKSDVHVKSSNDKELGTSEKELSKYKDTVLKNIRSTATKEDVQKLVSDFHDKQKKLLDLRFAEKGRLEFQLQEKLQEKTLRATAKETEDRKSKTITGMDEQFFTELSTMKQREQLTQDQVSGLIERHLDRTESFRKNLRQEVVMRRKNRVKNTPRVQSTEVRSLVEQHRQTDEKAQRLRQDEKERLDRKLMEKLDRRKVKRRSSKRKKAEAT